MRSWVTSEKIITSSFFPLAMALFWNKQSLSISLEVKIKVVSILKPQNKNVTNQLCSFHPPETFRACCLFVDLNRMRERGGREGGREGGRRSWRERETEKDREERKKG